MVMAPHQLPASLSPSFGPVLAYGKGAVAALRQIGCEPSRIHRARAVDEAIAVLEQHAFDAVVVDESRLGPGRASALAMLEFHRADAPLYLVGAAPAPPSRTARRRTPPRRGEPAPTATPAAAAPTDPVAPADRGTTIDPGGFAEACLDHVDDLPALERFVLETLAREVGARRASLLTGHPHRALLLGRAAIGLGEASVARWRVHLGQGLVGSAAERQRPLVGRGARGGARDYQGRVYVLLPFAGTGAAMGVIALTDLDDDTLPSEASLRRWAELARRAGRAIAVARRVVEAERNATIDPLTGLPNRRAYERAIVRELSRAARSGDRLGVALIDLDHFSQVNNRHGHDAGDAVLVEFARRLVPHFRTTDLLARWGGEEFVVILPSLPPTPGPEDVLAVERARLLIAGRPFRLPGGHGSVGVTFSAGVAAYPEHGTTPEALLKAADRALYRGKGAGRNRVVRAD